MIKLFRKAKQIYTRSKCWAKILFFICIILFALSLVDKKRMEGFSQKEKFLLKKGGNVYDNFYYNIYDKLLKNGVKNDYEIKEMLRITKTKGNALDIGSGTGHHVHLLNKKGIKTIGMDASPSAIAKAKENYPDLTFIEGKAEDGMIHQSESFNLITCLYFTLYYIKDKHLFFNNCFRWLAPGGHLVIHLVNRDKFDPILPAADPLYMVSPQKYAKKRITNSLVKFQNFQYKANFSIKNEKNIATFTETFKDDGTGNVRQNEHTLYVPIQKEILSLAKSAGFKVLGKIDMVGCQYEYQYLYVLEKPLR